MSDMFMNALVNGENRTTTENGAAAVKSTLNSCLDLFGSIGAMRANDEAEVLRNFSLAYGEDKLTALKMSFYARDVREGLGERRTFRLILKWLATNFPEDLRPNVKLIPFYGRWDDIYELEGTPLEDELIKVIKAEVDANGADSLIWKWLKSTNTSSPESRRLGRWTAENVFGDVNREKFYPVYRKKLKEGRAKINVVEAKMSSGEWSEIDYAKLTSYNNLRYINAFLNNDEERYTEFVVNNSIKGTVLFPYDIIHKIKNLYDTTGFSWMRRSPKEAKKDNIEKIVYDKMWKTLPNYDMTGEPTMVVVDTSGSMECSFSDKSSVTCLDVAVSLGMYFGERNQGALKDTFINFSNRPTLQTIKGDSIYEKFANLNRRNWDMSTNLESVFDLILNTGIENDMPNSQMPKRLMIISDMQFNNCVKEGKTSKSVKHTFVDSMKAKYAEAGYTFPQLVFWNVSHRGNFQITKDEDGFVLVSGASPSGFKAILAGETEVVETVEVQDVVTKEVFTVERTVRTINPVDAMMNTLNSERYSQITLG